MPQQMVAWIVFNVLSGQLPTAMDRRRVLTVQLVNGTLEMIHHGLGNERLLADQLVAIFGQRRNFTHEHPQIAFEVDEQFI